jgi:cytochrome c biogenesis protein CcmG/thiol:disulfide interchange protein DsbE
LTNVTEPSRTAPGDRPDASHETEPPTPPARGRAAHAAAVALAVAAGAGFLGLIIFGLLAQAPNTAIDDSLAAGRAAPAPPFNLAVLQRGDLGARMNGEVGAALAHGRLSLRQLRGTPVVLNIWASWCDPCKQEAPLLEHAWRTDGRPHRTLFLGLDQQDATNDASSFMRSYRVDYPNVRDPGSDVPRSYGATGIPETYFISPRGEVVDHVIGVITSAEMRDGILAARRGQPLGVKSGGARRPSR